MYLKSMAYSIPSLPSLSPERDVFRGVSLSLAVHDSVRQAKNETLIKFEHLLNCLVVLGGLGIDVNSEREGAYALREKFGSPVPKGKTNPHQSFA